MSNEQKHLENSKMPPSSVDVEEAVLGGLLVDAGVIGEVMALLKNPQVFYHQPNQKLYLAIRDLAQADKPVDMLTVAAELRKKKQLEDVGGEYRLVELSSRVSSTANIEHHCTILLQGFLKRELIRIGGQFVQQGYDAGSDALEVLDNAQAMLDEINLGISRTEEQSWKEILLAITASVETLSKSPDGVTGIPCGLKALDKAIGGWQPGELIILAARPGMGKTAMAVRWLATAAKQGKPVAVFQLEMSNQQFGKRILAVETDHFHANQFYKHGLKSDSDWEKFVQLISSVEDYPLHIIPKPGMTVFECMLEARRLKKKYDIQMVVVDYLQLMGGANKHRNSNREQEISEVSRNLKKLSLELNIPVIALSQLSRAVETRGGNKRPMLSDLRESGSIEQDADMVLFLYRPEYYGYEQTEDGQPAAGLCEVIIAKHRNGALGPEYVGFNDNRVKFHNLDDRQGHATAGHFLDEDENEDRRPF